MYRKKQTGIRIFQKVVLCFICVVLMFGTIRPTTIYAAETVVITVGQIPAAEPGERITVPITLNSNPGLAALLLNIGYDSSRLTIDSVGSVTQGTALSSLSYIGVSAATYASNPFRVLWFGIANDYSTGNLLNIEFTVLDNAFNGSAEITITLTPEDAIDLDGRPIPRSINPGVVTVVGGLDESETPVTPAPSPSPEPIQQPAPEPSPEPEQEEQPEPEASPEPDDTVPVPTPDVPVQSPAPDAGVPDTTPEPTAVPHEVLETQEVDVAELPPVIQNLAAGNPVFTAELPEHGQARGLLSIPHVRSGDVIPESIVAYRISLDGEVEMVIPSLYIENHSMVRLLGYAGELYMVDSNPVAFNDVSTAGWYHRAVSFVAARGLFAGVGNNMFAPQTTMTRGMFVTVLAQLDDFDASQYTVSPFADVDIQQWYGSAIAWARSAGIIDEGILSGGAPDMFRPYDRITREEMAVIFANYLAIRDFPVPSQPVPQFGDIDEASPWARDAIGAMRMHNIIYGIGNNLYNPQGEATRAEVSQIYTNLVRAIVGLS